MRRAWLTILFACSADGDKGTDVDSGPGAADDTGQSVSIDADQDGYSVEDGDCDDNDPLVHPDAEERWYDGIDND